MNVEYQKVASPQCDCTNIPVALTDATMQERLDKVLARMEAESYDSLVIYADLEHGNNFEYLTGFLPRFEEALLVLHKDGHAYMVMGNENLNKVAHARIPATAIHCPYFSLPNQPMEVEKDFQGIMEQTQLKAGSKVGLVGWKNFTSRFEDNRTLFDVPYYIVKTIQSIVGEKVYNATYLFIGENGARCTNNVNEIAHYEFGAALASDCMLKAMDALTPGISEMELGNILNAYGQKNSVVTIAASGPRFIKANLYPTENTVKVGDSISLTVGYKGDYLHVLVMPYMKPKN